MAQPPPTSRTVTVTTTRPPVQHPQQHTPAGGVQTPRAAAPTAAPAPAAPVRVMSQSSPGALLAAQRGADLRASIRDIPSLNPLAGITSGPGNQGSANTAHLIGHAGTTGTFLGQPRSVGGPGIGGGQPV